MLFVQLTLLGTSSCSIAMWTCLLGVAFRPGREDGDDAGLRGEPNELGKLD
jgi:hypothetical protein